MHLVADLSAIRVFKAGVYVALLIVEKKGVEVPERHSLSVIRCQRDAGVALDDFLDGNYPRTSSRAIFRADQQLLRRPTWSISLPEETQLLRRLEGLPRLSEFAHVTPGVITGADDVFILDSRDVPRGEEEIYAPYLPDMSIGQYALPDDTQKHMLYPFIDGAPVESEHMMRSFPLTWEWLSKNRERLSNRRSATQNAAEWWRPSRPRVPREMLSPKVVLPKLYLLPRFGVDVLGKWVVSHSPIIRPRHGEADIRLLYLFAAVLNSSLSTWYVDLNGRRFGRGYKEVGVSLLRGFPMPDFGQVPSVVVQEVVDRVSELMESDRDFDHSRASNLDDLVLRYLYQLSMEETAIVKSGTEF